MSNSLSTALRRWREILGTDNVLAGGETAPFESCPSGHRQPVAAVLYPRSVEEIRRIVSVASETGISLYPVSVGNNWGYGTAAPATPGAAVVSLRRMNRILSFDAAQGIVTLEPGVSQAELYEFLERAGHEFFVPVTGSSPQSSIVGNALERGFGITPYVDHFGAVISLEAVLPDGSLYVSAMHQAREGFEPASHRWGIGPYLDGLFGQGNFGIVTKVVLQLAKRTPAWGTMLAIPKDEAALFKMVEASRQLLQESGLSLISMKFINDLYVAAASHGPFRDLPKPLSADARETLRRNLGIPQWSCWMGVYGGDGTIKLARSLARKFIRPLAGKMYFFSDRNVRRLERLSPLIPARFFPRTSKQLHALIGGQKYLAGQPNEAAFRMAYWRSGEWKDGPPHEPGADGCAFNWYAPLVPFTDKAVRTFVDTIERTCAEIGVDPIMNFTAISGNCFYGLVVLTFDEASTDEERIAAYRHVLMEGMKVGLMPYRAPPFAMKTIAERAPASFELSARLKKMLDPQGIVAPGRYTVS